MLASPGISSSDDEVPDGILLIMLEPHVQKGFATPKEIQHKMARQTTSPPLSSVSCVKNHSDHLSDVFFFFL